VSEKGAGLKLACVYHCFDSTEATSIIWGFRSRDQSRYKEPLFMFL